MHKGSQGSKLAGRHADWQWARQSVRQAGRKSVREVGIEGGTQAEIEAGRQADRREISLNDAPWSAQRKAHCGMVQFRACGEDHLCFVGGTGLFHDRMKYESHQFVERPRSASRTNEIHCFNLSKGQWQYYRKHFKKYDLYMYLQDVDWMEN